MTDTTPTLLLAGVLLVNDHNELCLLFRKDKGYYVTPGGNVTQQDHPGLETPSFESFKKTAERELAEKLGTSFVRSELVYFGAVDFTVPGGQRALMTQFLCKFEEGTPTILEQETFDHFQFIPIDTLSDYSLSPDLKLLSPRLTSYFQKNE